MYCADNRKLRDKYKQHKDQTRWRKRVKGSNTRTSPSPRLSPRLSLRLSLGVLRTGVVHPILDFSGYGPICHGIPANKKTVSLFSS